MSSLKGSSPTTCCDQPVDTVLDGSDIEPINSCGTEVQPSIVIGVPIPGSGTGDSDLGKESFPLINGFSWPAVGGAVTVVVEDSSIYSPGNWVYVVDHGYLEITDIPGATALTLVNQGTTGNVVEAVPVPSGAHLVTSGAPKPDISTEVIEAAVAAEIALQLPDAIEAEVDPNPRWTNSLMLLANEGRLPILDFSEEPTRRLKYQTVLELGTGVLPVLSEPVTGDYRFDKLRPEATTYGDLGGFEFANPVDETSDHQFKKITPVDLEGSLGSNAPDFRLLSFVTETVAGGIFRKSWHALKKFVVPTAFVDAGDLTAQEVEILAVEKIDSDASLHFRRIAPEDGQILFGEDGKWKLGSAGNSLVPTSPESLLSGEYEGVALSVGGDYVNSQLAPTVPASATHALILVRLKFTLFHSDEATYTGSNAHSSTVQATSGALVLSEVAASQATSDGSSWKPATGTNAVMVLVPLDESQQIAFRVARTTSLGTGHTGTNTDRVTYNVSSLGYVGPIGS